MSQRQNSPSSATQIMLPLDQHPKNIGHQTSQVNMGRIDTQDEMSMGDSNQSKKFIENEIDELIHQNYTQNSQVSNNTKEEIQTLDNKENT